MNKDLDLDNLKESWKKDQISAHKYSRAELIRMLNKKSTNNVKYIVIISIIEFIVVFLSLFITSVDKSILNNLDAEAQENYLRNARISQYLSYVNIVISFIFIFYFYKCYKKINILNSTKEFINNILKFRKTVNIFIIVNFFLGMIILFLTGYYSFMGGFRKAFIDGYSNEIEKVHLPIHSPKYMLIFIIISFFLIAFVVVYYLLVYGVLLRKLKINLRELQKIDK